MQLPNRYNHWFCVYTFSLRLERGSGTDLDLVSSLIWLHRNVEMHCFPIWEIHGDFSQSGEFLPNLSRITFGSATVQQKAAGITETQAENGNTLLPWDSRNCSSLPDWHTSRQRILREHLTISHLRQCFAPVFAVHYKTQAGESSCFGWILLKRSSAVEQAMQNLWGNTGGFMIMKNINLW